MAKQDGVYLHIDGFDQFDRIDFDKKQVRRAMHRIGKWVTASAQMMIALSPGGAYPKNRTGTLIDSISYGVSRSGFLVKVMPAKTGGMQDYYPAYLHYGVKRGRVGKKGQRNQSKAGWRIAPRDNYMTEALDDNQSRIETLLAATLQKALRPK